MDHPSRVPHSTKHSEQFGYSFSQMHHSPYSFQVCLNNQELHLWPDHLAKNHIPFTISIRTDSIVLFCIIVPLPLFHSFAKPWHGGLALSMFLLCRIAGEFIVFRCKYMYYFCFFNLFGMFFSLFSRQMCKSFSRNRFPNLLKMSRLRLWRIERERADNYMLWCEKWPSYFRVRR